MTLTINTNGSNVTNSVTVEDAPAVLILGNSVVLTNAAGGILRSTSDTQPAISILGLNSHIVNRGAIEATFGYLTSILGNASNEQVDNYGTIYGWVRLGEGDDTFNQYFSAPAIGTATVDLGGGNDTYNLLVSPGPIIFGFVDGGSGEDSLNLLSEISLVYGFYFTGFEHLTVGANVTNLSNFSDLLSITLTAGGFNNFVNSVNPTLDISLQNNWFTIGPGSSFRNITGSENADTLSLNSGPSGFATLTGSANLGGGNDTVHISVFDTSSSNPVIAGLIDGGLGNDFIGVNTRSNQTVDLTSFINFEILKISTQAFAPNTVARVINANGLQKITGNATDVIAIGQSNSPNAQLWPGFGGPMTLEETTTIGNIGQDVGSAFNPYDLSELSTADAQYNLLVTNNGTILGDVQLYIGNDNYDGSLGSTGGTIFGYAGNDSLTGGIGGERIEGGYGNDILTGNGGIDILLGDAGDDALFGGIGADQLLGGEGNDRLFFDYADSVIDGGIGSDTMVVGSTGMLAILPASIEALEFAAGAILTLTGTQFANGLASNSALSGTGTLTVNMTAGVNFLASGMSFTSTVGTVVNGTSGIDIIKLGLGASTGNTINSGDGVDQIRGSNGVDTINGGIGNDKIMGIGGADVLTGGTGNDQFRYFQQSDSGLGAAADRVTDFTIGGDKLSFLLIDADAVAAGDQAFNFVGTAAFANTGVGQIRYQNSGADLLVQADVNGDGVADMEIILQGLAGGTLTAGDFIL